MANCTDCLECVKMFGGKGTMFFCDEDDDIPDSKFEKDHDCKSYNPDKHPDKEIKKIEVVDPDQLQMFN